MAVSFSETIKRLRVSKNLSQQQLADMLNVNRSTIARWETDSCVPTLDTVSKIVDFFNIDLNAFITSDESENINIIMVDDEKIIFDGNIDILKDFFPKATFNGFISAQSALAYAENNKVDLAFLDIEMGGMNGIELCSRLLELNPRTNVIYLTGYSEYSIDAWGTGASGFLLKPLSEEKINQALDMLRYPIGGAV